MDNIVINAPCGNIKGFNTENYHYFRSIPYAVTKRFEDPKPVEYMEEFDATAKPKNCYQRFCFVDESKEDGFYYREFDTYRISDYVESPMTLSITTPTNPDNCPVILFVHGGSYENGTIDDCPFGECVEYAKRGIILVSVGYRLNVFGLFGGENYGLKDIVFSIDWIRENIKAFGGNPDNITLMGQSAGAMCVNDLLYSPLVDGKIKGAVMMSGGGLYPRPFGVQPKEKSKAFWKKVMVNAEFETIDELKYCDPEKLWWAWNNAKKSEGNLASSIPAIDGAVLTDYPSEIIKADKDVNVPVICGVTSQDIFPFMIYEIAHSLAKDRVKREKAPVYGYMFDVTLPGNSYKAFHASDLWYMFGNMEKSWRPFDETDKAISKEMIDYVANFATTQNPNGHGMTEWKPVSKSNSTFRLFSKSDKKYATPVDCRLKMAKTMLGDKGPM